MYQLQTLMSMRVVYEYRDDAMVVCTMILKERCSYTYIHTPDNGILHTCKVKTDNYYAD